MLYTMEPAPGSRFTCKTSSLGLSPRDANRIYKHGMSENQREFLNAQARNQATALLQLEPLGSA